MPWSGRYGEAAERAPKAVCPRFVSKLSLHLMQIGAARRIEGVLGWAEVVPTAIDPLSPPKPWHILQRSRRRRGPTFVAVLVGPVICLLSMPEGARRSLPSRVNPVPSVESASAC